MEPLHDSEQQLMELFQVDDDGLLFVSPEILDWKPLTERKVKLVIDLEGEIDRDVPTVPNSMVYVYFPFDDDQLPDLVKLHALGRLAAEMIRNKRAVLIHCSMGFNRSPLRAGVTFTYLGLTGPQALEKLREKRAGALYNSAYADYLVTLPAHGAPA